MLRARTSSKSPWAPFAVAWRQVESFVDLERNRFNKASPFSERASGCWLLLKKGDDFGLLWLSRWFLYRWLPTTGCWDEKQTATMGKSERRVKRLMFCKNDEEILPVIFRCREMGCSDSSMYNESMVLLSMKWSMVVGTMCKMPIIFYFFLQMHVSKGLKFKVLKFEKDTDPLPQKHRLASLSPSQPTAELSGTVNPIFRRFHCKDSVFASYY